MNKTSFLFLLLMGAIVLIGAYNSLFPVPASTSFIRFFALSGFLLLCVSLMLGPLMFISPAVFGQLIEPRRAVGISCFVFVLLHILLVLSVRFGFDILAMVGAYAPLVTIPATLILFVLTITSSDFAIKLMGAGLWKNVQRFNYLAFVLAFWHFFISSNGLFINVRGTTFVNLSEVALMLLGILTVVLQVWGYFLRKAKAKENQAKMAAKPAPS
jgi:DMSO/TMAO reductase YedYZ heme-binding membrane subunit